MAGIIVGINAASALTGLILNAAVAMQAYAKVQAQAQAEGREVNLEDLKGLRSADGVVDHQLEAVIAAHEQAASGTMKVDP